MTDERGVIGWSDDPWGTYRRSSVPTLARVLARTDPTAAIAVLGASIRASSSRLREWEAIHELAWALHLEGLTRIRSDFASTRESAAVQIEALRTLAGTVRELGEEIAGYGGAGEVARAYAGMAEDLVTRRAEIEAIAPLVADPEPPDRRPTRPDGWAKRDGRQLRSPDGWIEFEPSDPGQSARARWLIGVLPEDSIVLDGPGILRVRAVVAPCSSVLAEYWVRTGRGPLLAELQRDRVDITTAPLDGAALE